VSLARSLLINNLSAACLTGVRINRAEGTLTERLGIDPGQAFAYLRRASKSENRKLITKCHEIVNTRLAQ
jgi:AmiR/NasT family two-component response regulator